MIRLHKIIATVFGIGYIGKGGGTVAAVAYCSLLLLIPSDYYASLQQFIATSVVVALGVWSGNSVDAIWGKDSNKVVIDEVAGMMITLIFLPGNLKIILAGLLLFRFFDITKPLLIKRMELLPKGWGVMADDILAGFYARIILQIIVVYKLI